MNNLIVLVICSCCIEIATGHPTTPLPRTTPEQDISPEDAEEWLKKYDYVPRSGAKGPAATKDLSEALKKMQKYAGIKETGKLDEETKKMMSSPRCGNSDVQIKVSKRFSAQARWSYKSLTYRISNYPTNSYNLYYNSYVDYFIEKAFAHWSRVSQLTFTKSSSANVDITIGFYSRNHGDGNPFDGEGNTLAHAYFPDDGRIHCDNEERWSYTQFGGPNLEQVMTHEIGHALGLGHSTVRSAVMYAYYKYNANFALHQDDINGIVYLYGRNDGSIPQSSTTTRPTTTTTTRSTTTRPDTTTDFRFFSTEMPKDDGTIVISKQSWVEVKTLLYRLYVLVSRLE